MLHIYQGKWCEIPKMVRTSGDHESLRLPEQTFILNSLLAAKRWGLAASKIYD
jgi:hypothetical protein